MASIEKACKTIEQTQKNKTCFLQDGAAMTEKQFTPDAAPSCKKRCVFVCFLWFAQWYCMLFFHRGHWLCWVFLLFDHVFVILDFVILDFVNTNMNATLENQKNKKKMRMASIERQAKTIENTTDIHFLLARWSSIRFEMFFVHGCSIMYFFVVFVCFPAVW